MPPLTYFMAGTMSVPEYFRLVTERTPCGLVLDIGHLWTVYRYTAASRQSSLAQFVERFLDEFPMERVIEIHIAGLSVHEAGQHAAVQGGSPEWIDAHAAPIPAESWTILDQVLMHPRLRHLRGVALEVDTKPLELILEEFTDARGHVAPMIERLMDSETPAPTAIFESLKGDGGPIRPRWIIADSKPTISGMRESLQVRNRRTDLRGRLSQRIRRAWNVTFMPIFPMKSCIGEGNCPTCFPKPAKV